MRTTDPSARRYWFTWVLLGALRVLALLPLSIARAAGAALGLFMYAANAKRRRIACINLRMCFPRLAPDERRRLLRRHFRLAGQAYLDIGYFAWASERRVQRKAHIRGLEHLQAALGARKGVILLAPHCIGMNVGGIMIAKHYPVFSMIKPQPNPVIDGLLNKARARYGSPLVARGAGLRPVVRGLTARQMFYYLPDEDFGPKHSVFVPFFGVPCATLTTLGRLARLADAVVIPCFTRLLPRGRGYEVVLRPPLERFPSGDATADAALMNQALEDGIRPMPEQYMWTFRLFHTRPAGARSPYD